MVIETDFTNHITNKTEDGGWYLDTGCSSHMTWIKSMLFNYKKLHVQNFPLVITWWVSPKVWDALKDQMWLSRMSPMWRVLSKISWVWDNCVMMIMKCISRRSLEQYFVQRENPNACQKGQQMNSADPNLETCFSAISKKNLNWSWHKRLSHLNSRTSKSYLLVNMWEVYLC